MTHRREFPDSFEGVLKLTAFMRGPEGCPWDREQTHESLKAGLIEECYELVEAIESGDPDALAEELGDLAINAALPPRHSLASAARSRPPRVFGGLIDKIRAPSPPRLRRRRSRYPRRRQGGSGRAVQTLRKGRPPARPPSPASPAVCPPSRTRSPYRKRAARLGFDWDDVGGVLEKSGRGDPPELRDAHTRRRKRSRVRRRPLLPRQTPPAGWASTAEAALRGANARFYRRFKRDGARRQPAAASPSAMSRCHEKEALWQASKNKSVRPES